MRNKNVYVYTMVEFVFILHHNSRISLPERNPQFHQSLHQIPSVVNGTESPTKQIPADNQMSTIIVDWIFQMLSEKAGFNGTASNMYTIETQIV